MIEVLTFIFASFWRWLGVFLIIAAIGGGFANLLALLVVRRSSR